MKSVALLTLLPLVAAGLPLSFEPNVGQTDPQVKFLARAPGYTLFVTAGEAVFAARDGSVERMHFVGANPAPRLEPLDKQPGISNYFIGNHPSRWRTNIPNYAKFALRQVYPGIDLIFYGSGDRLEYDWIVAPGADPHRIRVRWDTPAEISETSSGSLILSASLEQSQPVISQEGRPLSGGYLLAGKEVRFDVPKYDRTKPLIIDPVVFVYSTYLGGAGASLIIGAEGDAAAAIAVDSSGNAYVAGSTASTNFPTVTALQGSNRAASGITAFVSKINPAGTALVYSTYVGGSTQDAALGIAVDSSGDAYLTGSTNSADFPLVNPILSTLNATAGGAFVTKLNPSGSALLYSTFLTGSGDTQDGYAIGDSGNAIAVDSSGNAYVAGAAASQNFPVVNPIQSVNLAYANHGANAFVTKINPAGSAFVYSTFLGGATFDQANGIAVDSSGNAYVTGATYSSGFPTVNPIDAQIRSGSAHTGFVTKINAAGSALMYSTYLGGSATGVKGNYNGDDPGGIAVDSAGNAYIAGSTMSLDFPTANAFQPTLAVNGSVNAFVTKINPAGSALIYSTFLGDHAAAYGIAVDSRGDAFVTGYTQSQSFPTVDALQPSLNLAGSTGTVTNAFVTAFNASGSAPIYSTYLGGNVNDAANAIAVDKSGDAFIAGSALSKNFPTQGPLQAKNPDSVGASTAFVSVIAAPPVLSNPPAFFNITGGNNQSGLPGNPLPQALTVLVTGSTSLAIPGITVDFTVTSGNATLSSTAVQTNSSGAASVTLTLGAAGNVTVTASIPGSSIAPLIFTATALTSATCPVGPPVITSVNFATDFGGFSSFSSGSYLEVKGNNLAIDSRQWAQSDFQGANAPTTLDTTKVSINSIPGYVSYISGIQVNVQAPSDPATGPVPIVVTNCAGSSNTYLLQKTALSPGMLAPASFNGGKQYLAALFAADLGQGVVTWVGTSGLIAGASFRPAKPGDTIIAYGLGFGNVTPATPPGVIASGATSLAGLSVSFGPTPATISYAGLYPGYVGLYEFYVTVPNLADGDYQINVSIDGTPVPQTFFLTVQQ